MSAFFEYFVSQEINLQVYEFLNSFPWEWYQTIFLNVLRYFGEDAQSMGFHWISEKRQVEEFTLPGNKRA